MKLIQLFLLFVSIPTLSLGQDIKSEFLKMDTYLASLPIYQLKVDYSAADAQLIEEGNVSVIVHPKGLFYELDNAHFMINEKNTVFIDDHEKMLVYSDNIDVSKGKKFKLSDQLLRGLDTLIAKSDTMFFYKQNEDRNYTFRFSNSYFDMIEMTFSDHLLKKVVYFYNDEFVSQTGTKTTCKVNINTSPEVDEKIFETSFYIIDKNGQKVPSENFSNYLITYNEALENYLD